MKHKKPAAFITAAVLLIAMIVISSVSRQNSDKSAARQTAATVSQAYPVHTDETTDDMRAVWVSFMDLTMEYESDKSEAAFTDKFDSIAAECKDFGFNTLIVQVRPFCDALYESSIYPPSHILSGEQGKSAGYDALSIICDICGKYGLKLHAWVNPYRVTAENTPSKLSADNPYIIESGLGIETESGIILDPSNEKTRRLITDGVKEIVENYPVDGIQFDDYFYPEDIEDEDSDSYESYLETAPKDSAMDLHTWRCFNVDLLIAETYMTVHKSRADAVFGVSPQGNLSNNDFLCADVVTWCGKKGYIDYICPQLYLSIDHPYLGFETALNEWESLSYAEGVRLYAGLAGYKAGSDADGGTWLDSDDMLAREYNILKRNNKYKGFMLYSYASLNDPKAEKELENLKEAIGTVDS